LCGRQVAGVSQSRRLAAILAADVVGYSRLMGADEEGTLERLKALRHELIDPNIAKHHGRMIKTTGDGLLVEFASVVDAVRCAAEVQQAVPGWNGGIMTDRRIELRIGINLGDVIADGDDLYGDGVNIAARIEALADAGGVFVSGTVYDQVRDRLPFGFQDIGEQQVKNITRPVRVYRVLLNEMTWAPGVAPPPLPNKPSIAVLPFQNMSGDPEQEYFSDGVSSDIITALSRNHSLFVISRSSSFTYRGRSIDVRQVSRELGVRYVVEGGVRRSGDTARVSAQLVEGDTGKHLWAERYDRDISKVFVVQDEITAAVTAAILPAVTDAEQRRALRKPPESLGAWEVYQRGLWHFGKVTPADTEQARVYFERAIGLDCGFAAAYSYLALTYVTEGGVFAARLIDETARLAATAARRAVEYDPQDADALSTIAYAAFLTGNHQEAHKWASRADACGASSAWVSGIKGVLLVWSGHPSEGRNTMRTALRLNPRDPRNRLFGSSIAASYYFQHDYVAAVDAANWAITEYPAYPNPYRWLTASLGQLGKVEDAREALRQAVAVSPTGFDLHVRSRPAWFLPEQYEHLLDGLRKAGWQSSGK
jgi:adenylate cyclase